MAFYSFVFAAGMKLAHRRGGKEAHDAGALLRVSYQTQAITFINAQLQDPKEPPSDALLLSILILAVHGPNADATYGDSHPQSPLATTQLLDWYGNMTFNPLHMQALYMLVKQRGGLDAIDLYGGADTIL